MLPAEDATTLPLLFHLNSEPWLNLAAYADPSNEVRYGAEDPGELIALPPTRADSPVRQALLGRRSCRRFRRRTLPSERLAELLEGAYGGIGLAQYLPGQTQLARPVPSAGGLYPLELYVATQDVADVPDGLHRYSVLYHGLATLSSAACLPSIGGLLLDQHFVEDANVLVLLSAVLPRTLNKYGPRGYRYVLLEAGHCAQNLCLLAAEAGLGAICLGGFNDTRLNRFLGLDGRTEAVLYCVAIGFDAARGET
jgi:SagB-type dehydrogenase family enzyme